MGVLHLTTETNPQWASVAADHLVQLLQDHADCELKAASTAMSLVPKLGDAPADADALLGLAEEELGHYRLVIKALYARGGCPDLPDRNLYVEALRSAAATSRKDDRDTSEDRVLLDRLLILSLIEARSCERFLVLSRELEARREVELASLYRELFEAEAGHHRLFTSIAERRFGAACVQPRLSWLAGEEGKIAAGLGRAPRIHG